MIRLVAASVLITASFTVADVLSIDVVDGDGNPVRAAEAYLIEGNYDLPGTRAWVPGNAGRIEIEPDHLSKFVQGELEGKATLVVRAPGHAWATMALSLPSQEPVEVTLDTGRAVELIMPGLPEDVVPVVYVAGQSVAAWIANVQEHRSRAEDPNATFSACVVERLGDGRYLARLAPDTTEFWVMVEHPGVLRAFQAGPFQVEQRVEVDVPQPVSLTVDVAPEEGQPADYDACAALIMVSPTIPDGGWSFRLDTHFNNAKSMSWTLDDLAPGHYGVEASTGNEATWQDTTRDDYFKARDWVDIRAIESLTTTLALKTYDEAAVLASIAEAPGSVLTLVGATGAAPEGLPYAVSLRVNGFDRSVTLAEGQVPADGRIEVEHLPAGDVGYASLVVDGERAASLSADDRDVTIHLAPRVGEKAPDFEMRDIITGETVRVRDYAGQVLLLEFWASWCGPCQQPMAHNNEIAGAHADDWKGRAAILGVSVDNELETIQEHVAKRGWTDVRQVWCDGAWKSEGARKYAVTGVPSAFLIDQAGVVVWTGHPAGLDVEARFAELLD